MGALVDQCEAWGLVTRTPDPLDARARRVQFTADRAGLAGGLSSRSVAQAEAEFRASVGPMWPPWWRWAWRPTQGMSVPAAIARPGQDPRRSRRHAMRILIAEDDQVLADGLLRSLRTSGAAVDHVATGTRPTRR